MNTRRRGRGRLARGRSSRGQPLPFHQAAREFVPHNAQITIKADQEDDWGDLAIFPPERSLYQDGQFAD
jgi:hypothetical protein